MKMGFWLVIVFIGLMCGLPVGAQTTWYVATNGSDSAHTGTNSWTNAFQTISNAVAMAGAGDEMLVSNGVYELTAEISVTKAVTIRSWNNGVIDRTNTVIKGNGIDFRCVFWNQVSATLEGFTITNGIESVGGGVYLVHGTVRNCIITGNTSGGDGGGVYLRPDAYLLDSLICYNNATDYGGGVMLYADGIVSNCVIISNSAAAGGGVMLNFYGGTTGTVVGCEIRDNLAVSGGGVWNNNIGYIRNCIITGNSATNGGDGGGLRFDSSGTIENCVISNNYADDDGGGVSLGKVGGSALMRNCLITHNQATNSDNGGRGGGVSTVINTSSVRLENCTICYNQSDGTGGGVVIWNPTGDVINVKNCIVYYNTSTGSTSSNVYRGNVQYSCAGPDSTFTSGFCNTTNPPLFISTNANNYRLQDSSPCINTGTNEDWMAGAVDFDGHRRIDYFIRRVDMGAYEYLPSGTMIKVH